jgi:hypothetical protein
MRLKISDRQVLAIAARAFGTAAPRIPATYLLEPYQGMRMLRVTLESGKQYGCLVIERHWNAGDVYDCCWNLADSIQAAKEAGEF